MSAPVVRVIQGSPCLVYEWPEPPTPHVAYAREHALVSRVWEASEGRRWDVVPFHGWQRDTFVAGARLSLDGERYEDIREGEQVLESVREGVVS